MTVAPSCLNKTSFVAMLEQWTQRLRLSLTSILGFGCTSIGVIDISLLVSDFISFYYNRRPYVPRKVSSEVNSLLHLSQRYNVVEPI